MANIRQVAKEAGVSITTVSRVLSGDESFSVREETKRKVMDAVAKLGYKIPVREQDLIRLGCVMAMTSEKYSDPFFSEILSGIERGCATRGAVFSVFTAYFTPFTPPAIVSRITLAEPTVCAVGAVMV